MRVAGQLHPRVIKEVVRDNFDAFARCYEGGLARNAELSGIVTASFVIGASGDVEEVRDGGSDLPDASVVKCVLDAFAKLHFPAPDTGIVLVTYPIALSAD